MVSRASSGLAGARTAGDLGRDTRRMDDAPSVLALIPGYQAGPWIGRVVTASRAYLPVVVVDDGSTDDTAAEAETAGATVHPSGAERR